MSDRSESGEESGSDSSSAGQSITIFHFHSRFGKKKYFFLLIRRKKIGGNFFCSPLWKNLLLTKPCKSFTAIKGGNKSRRTMFLKCSPSTTNSKNVQLLAVFSQNTFICTLVNFCRNLPIDYRKLSVTDCLLTNFLRSVTTNKSLCNYFRKRWRTRWWRTSQQWQWRATQLVTVFWLHLFPYKITKVNSWRADNSSLRVSKL